MIAEKLQEIAGIGPAAALWYSGDEESWKKKPVSKKLTFLTKEDQEAHRCYEERKDWVMNHQQESVSEHYTSLKRQTHRYDQGVRALQFFQPDDHADLACKVLAIADWVEEFNGMSPHPIPDIPPELEAPYSGYLHALGQIPMWLTSEEPGVTDVQTRSQAMWIYLCALLQYYEDDMAAWEGSLYGGRTRRPSALILYIMTHVNPCLPEQYQVEWPGIIRRTPWLAA